MFCLLSFFFFGGSRCVSTGYERRCPDEYLQRAPTANVNLTYLLELYFRGLLEDA